MRYMAYNVIKT